MKKILTLLCAVAVTFSLIGCASVTVPTYEYNCLGKNGTCPTKQSNPLDFFCAVCDPDHDNIEGIKSETDSDTAAPPSEAPPADSDISDGSDATAPSEETSSPASDSGEANSEAPSAEVEEEPISPPTAREEKALKAAKSHLSSADFSRSGLIQRLKAEGFSASEAAFAAENCGSDWYKQAEKAAEKYLSRASFPRNLLVKQLELDGYTAEQAEHGAATVYDAPLASYPLKTIELNII